tara:strand:- start:2031 stop:2186 length:156 start_codon:yes stop_codon:yes gene_type:complete
MRIIEARQSETSPLRYHIELTPEEFEDVKDLVYNIVLRIKENEKKQRDNIR